MAEKKSIIEEAMLDIKNIQNALNANTKEILRSVAKEEIDSVVKESLLTMEKNDLYEEEEFDEITLGDDSEELEGGLDDMGDSEEMGAEPEMGMEPKMGMDVDALDIEDMDMTGASDDDVIAIYKKMSGEDEIEIVGDELRLNVQEPGEYIVKLDSLKGKEEMDMGSDMEDLDMGSNMGSDMEDLDMDSNMGSDMEELDMDSDMEDESEYDVEYDIEMDAEGGLPTVGGEEESEEEESEEEESEEEESEEEESEEEEVLDETRYVGGKVKYVATAHTNAKLQEEALLKSKKLVYETAKKYNTLLKEATKLKSENEQFRGALKEFRTKLIETVVWNTNLASVTSLFTEHSTTKTEKESILKRFDNATSIKESKKLAKTIEGELESRKSISESVESKIIKESTTSVSRNLNESNAYVDPSTKRIMDLINRVEKR